MSRFVTKKVSPARRKPAGAINVRSSSPRKLYSTFADQLGAKAHSIPAPTRKMLLLLLEALIDAPVVRLVTVKSSFPTQPPPACHKRARGHLSGRTAQKGCDPSIIGSHLDSSGTRNEYGTGVVVIRSSIELGFNSENSVADLPVVPELASPDEHAVVVSAPEVRAEEGVCHITVSPSPPNVAAKINSGPTERRRCIDRRRRRIRSRPRVHVSGIRGHRRCQQRRERLGNAANALFLITWFKGSIDFERIHPLEAGFLRLKFRRDRRSGIEREPVWKFYPRYFGETAVKLARWATLYLRLRRIYLRIKRDPHRFAYTDLATCVMNDEETSTLELFGTEAAQAYVREQRRLKEVRNARAVPSGRLPRTPMFRMFFSRRMDRHARARVRALRDFACSAISEATRASSRSVCSHSSLDCTEGMLDGFAPLAHLLRMLVEPLNGLKMCSFSHRVIRRRSA